MPRHGFSASFFALLFLPAAIAQPSQIIVTIAGGGAGDGDAATASALTLSAGGMSGLALAPDGSLYVSEPANHRIRKVTPGGVITTVAGNLTPGYSGDGGPGAAAQLDSPHGIALDRDGALYIADTENSCIRKLLPDGTILTVVGTGVAGYTGDGGPPTLARLWEPLNVAIDAAGQLYIADWSANKVRKVGLDGKIITVAGNGAPGFGGDGGLAVNAQLYHPSGLAIDPSGILYIADSHNHRIRKVTLDGKIYTLTGDGSTCYGACGDGGLVAAAQINVPYGLASDASGNLYIADIYNQNIREITVDGKISTYVGQPGRYGFTGDGGNRANALLYLPSNVVSDGAGNLFVVDGGNNRIRKVTAAGIVSTVAGNGATSFTGDGGPAIAAQLNEPFDAAIDSSGTLYFVDTFNNRVREVRSDGTITTVAGTGVPGFNGDGQATTAQLFNPGALAFNPSGTLYISDTLNGRIRKLDNGQLITVAGNGVNAYGGDGGPATRASFFGAASIAFDAAGDLFFTDFYNHRVREVDVSGTMSTYAGNGVPGTAGDGGQAKAASLTYPYGVAVDGAGNLYISEGSHRVRKVTPGGVISTFAGNGTAGYSGDGGPATTAQFDQPEGLAFDSAGNLYIADNANQAIRKVDHATGIVSTVVGNGSRGHSGDGGLATSAQLEFPSGLAFDRSGNMYIGGNTDRIRKVFTPPVVVNTSPAGLLISVDGGTPAKAPLWFNWTAGSQHTIRATTPQPGADAWSRYVFVNWSDGQAQTHAVTVPAAPTTYTATFKTQYQLQTIVSPADTGSITVTPASADGYYDAGTSVQVTAVPTSGYYFSNWGTNPALRESPITFTMDDAYVVQATFLNFSMGLPDVTIRQTHSGAFNAGGTGAFTLTVSNAGTWDSTSGAVTVIETLPSGLTPSSVNGNIWTCGIAGQVVTCSRSDTLASAASFDPITVNVSVTATAAAHVTVTATVSGGGDAAPGNNTAIDEVTFGAPDLSIAVSHAGDFAPFGSGSYTVNVANVSTNTATLGIVTVIDTVPVTFTPATATGGGWGCSIAGQTVTCTRHDSLPAGSSYATITIGVAMGSGVPPEVTDTATVAVAGDLNSANNVASDTLDLSGILTTVAGQFTGDGSAPTAIATWSDYLSKMQVVVDSTGALYFADSSRGLIRKWTPGSGVITVVAGNGANSTYGDGGAAVSAGLRGVTDLTVGADGAIYFVDDSLVRKVTPGGIISTIAGGGTDLADGIPATAAEFDGPWAIAIDSAGNVYIGDTNSVRIRRVDSVTGIVQTIAGGGLSEDGDDRCSGVCGDGGPAINAQFHTISHLTFDSHDNLFVTDENNCRIRKIDRITGNIDTVAGAPGGVVGCIADAGDGGPAIGAGLMFPAGTAVDSAGNLYIADEQHQRIRKVDAVTGLITTVAGSGAKGYSGDGELAVKAQLQYPTSVAVDRLGNLYIGDNENGRIRKVTPGGTILTVVGEGLCLHADDGDPATQAEFSYPSGVAADRLGNIFIADQNNNRVRKISPTGVITTFAGIGQRQGLDSGDGGPATAAHLNFPLNIATDTFGNVFIGELSGDRVRKVDAAGNISTILNVYGGGISATDAAGNLYTADWMSHRVIKTTPAGASSYIAGTGYAGYSGDGGNAAFAKLNSPGGIGLDSSGNLYIADSANNVVRKVDAVTRIITTIAGTGQNGYRGDGGPATSALLDYPYGLTVDNSGNVFFSQFRNQVVRKITPAGIISTVAGNGSMGYSGDGGHAVAGQLDQPGMLAVDPNGNLLVVEESNNRIRKISWQPTTLVTIDTSPTGLPVTIDSAALVAPHTLAWTPGSTHTVAVSTPQAIASGSRYAFSNWSDGGAPSHAITAPAAPATFTAEFTTQYQLTLAASPSGGGTVAAEPASADGYYNSGAEVRVSAQGAAPLVFSSFGGDVGGPASPQTLTMSAPKSVTASFAAPPATGTVHVFTNIAAAFTLSGAANYSGNGPWWWLSGSPVGSYTVNFSAVPGYNAPAAQTLTLTAGGTIAFTGTYLSITACDLDGNGTAAVADVLWIVGEGLTKPLTGHDINHDGSVNVTDIQMVVNAAMGLACGGA